MAALRELAGGRADLLAEVAGLLEGARAGEPDEPLARQAVGLCRKAGADPEAIPAWANHSLILLTVTTTRQCGGARGRHTQDPECGGSRRTD